MNDPTRSGAIIPAAALVGLLFFDALRVWLPSLLFVVADAGSTSAVIMGAIALGVALLAPVLCTLGRHRAGRFWWAVGIASLVIGRFGLQLSDGGMWQFATSSVMIVGTGLSFGAIAGSRAVGYQARTAALMGCVGSITLHAALGTTDLAWRDGLTTWLSLAVILVATLVAGHGARPLFSESEVERPSGAGWPWLVLGAAFLLMAVLTAPPGRVVIATDWHDTAVVATIAVAHGLAIMAAITARWLGPSITGPVSAGLVLIGAAGALQPASVAAVGAQMLLAVGLGLTIGMVDRQDLSTSLRPRRVMGAASPLVLVTIGFLYYAGYDLSLPFPNRLILLLTAVGLAGAALFVTRSRPREALRERGLAQQIGVVALATMMVTGAAAISVPSGQVPDPQPGETGESITVALYNIHMSFDPRGRMSLEDIGDELASRKPDIVVLNEVDRGWLTTGTHEPLGYLKQRLDMPYVFGPAADEVWGNAVLSRFPITEVSIERLPRGRDAMSRSQLIVLLEARPDERIALIATHLSHVDVQGDTRMPQARALAGTVARLQERGLPVIIAGDLNAQPSSNELESFGNLARLATDEGTPTFPSWAPEVQIDHILVTNRFDVVGTEIPLVRASDHLPVFAELQLTNP